jgi:hypothetical protein
MDKNKLYTNIKRTGRDLVLIGLSAAATYMIMKGDAPSTSVPIKPIGFPKGYHIENVDIETRGEIIDVKRIPEENYIITENKKTGIITFKGEFEYDIKPSIWFTPNGENETDNEGHSLDKKYFHDKRPGIVRIHKDSKSTESIDAVVNKK